MCPFLLSLHNSFNFPLYLFVFASSFVPVIKIWVMTFIHLSIFYIFTTLNIFFFNLTDVFCLARPALDFLSKHINFSSASCVFMSFITFLTRSRILLVVVYNCLISPVSDG